MDIFEHSPELIRDFLNYQLTIQNKSKNTVKEYYYDLRTFFRFLKNKRNPQDNILFEEIKIDDIDLKFIKTITAGDLYSYMSFVNINRDNSATTRARKVSSIRSFFKYLNEKAGVLDENPALKLENPKLRKTLPTYLSLDESKKLLKTVNSERDLCILTLFLNCGMRLSELVGINLSNIREDTIKILGKGNKERTVYLNESCKTSIRNYLRVRPNENVIDKDALFISRNKKRISNRMVQTLVKKYIEAAGLDPEKYSPHKLRHTAATLMYQYADADIRVLQEILGHENLNTTQIYTHVENKQLKETSMKHPLG